MSMFSGSPPRQALEPASPIDDRRLMQLAAERPLPVFPALRDATSLTPWLGLFAAFPAILALPHIATTTADAWSGLQTLQLATTDRLSQFFDPAARDASLPFRFQPPLGNWLAAWTIRVTDSSGDAASRVWTLLPTVSLIACVYLLANRIGGRSMALITSLLISLHPAFLSMSQRNSSHALALLLTVMAMHAFVSHLQDASTVVSLKLIPAGLSLGLCLLAGGPLAITTLGILALHLIVLKTQPRGTESLMDSSMSFVLKRRSSYRSLLTLALTAFAASGWWLLMMTAEHGIDFWASWLTGKPAASPDGSGAFAISATSTGLPDVFGPLAIVGMLGLWATMKRLLLESSDTRQSDLWLLPSWLAVSGGLVWFSAGTSSPLNRLPELYQLAFWIPVAMLASLGVIAICERHASFPVSIGCLVATLAMSAHDWLRIKGPSRLEAEPPDWRLVLTLVVGALFGGLYARRRLPRDAVQRVVLRGLLITIAGGLSLQGVATSRQTNPDDVELATVRSQLRPVADVDELILVAPPDADADASPLPVELRNTIRSVWPLADEVQTATWDAALATAGSRDFSGRRRVIVSWGRDAPASAVATAANRIASQPMFYRGREVLAFHIDAGVESHRE